MISSTSASVEIFFPSHEFSNVRAKFSMRSEENVSCPTTKMWCGSLYIYSYNFMHASEVRWGRKLFIIGSSYLTIHSDLIAIQYSFVWLSRVHERISSIKIIRYACIWKWGKSHSKSGLINIMIRFNLNETGTTVVPGKSFVWKAWNF